MATSLEEDRAISLAKQATDLADSGRVEVFILFMLLPQSLTGGEPGRSSSVERSRFSRPW